MGVRRLQAGGLSLELAEAGAGGRPLLLVHGFTGSKDDYLPFLDPLAARGWHAVAPDLRGHGGSDKPEGEDAYDLPMFATDLLALADALGWERFALLGLSLGGMIAQELVIDRPERVSALVLMDTAPGPVHVDAELVERARRLVREQGMAALLEVMSGDSEQDPMKTPASRRLLRERPEYADESDRRFLGSSRDMWLSVSEQLLTRPDRLRQLGALAVPTLVIAGEQDPLLPDCEAMAHAIPGARFAVIPDAGHSPHLENPDAWWPVLAAFLDEMQAKSQ